MKQFQIFMMVFFCALSSTAFSTPMDIAEYSNRAEVDAGVNGRCVNEPIQISECHMRIDWSVDNGKMTKRAGDWGKANGFFPVIDFFSQDIAAVCKCGCFEQDTLIRVSDGFGTFDIAAKHINKQEHGLVGVSSDSTLQSITTENFGIKFRAVGPEVPELYVFSFEDGSELSVTQHHGMLLGDGSMTSAKEVKVADTMIRADGAEITVTEISRETTEHDVYNFETDGNTNVNHIIVANGIFVGDLAWQNQLHAELGKVLIRQ